MPTKSIVGIRQNRLGFLRSFFYPKTKIDDIQGRSARIIKKPSNKFKSVESKDYGKISLKRVNYGVIYPSEVLPFRVRFTNINVPPYDQFNPPPIGIAVIGVNNYIL